MTAPEPLTPPDCDLRGLEWMPLYGDRLLTSETWLLASPEGRCAALALWWAAWKQTPAASLADDDRLLSQLAGYGVAVKAWKAIRDEALRGWVKCSDGRLYHPVVAALAVEAWDKRVRARERKARWRAGHDDDGGASGTGTGAGTERGQERSGDGDGDVPGTPRSPLTGQERTGQDISKIYSVPSGTARSPAAPSPAASPPPDARSALWTEGLSRLRRLTGKPEGAARKLLGQLSRDAFDDCALVASLLHEAEAARIGDPIPWLQAAIRTRTGASGGSRRSADDTWWAEPDAPTPIILDAVAEHVQ